GKLESIVAGKRESMIYIEMERADARTRRSLVAELERTLAQVRDAVNDWRALQSAVGSDAATVGSREGAKLLRWFQEGAMTLLGHETW
ncbi:NAD-glutamate dehydrogenase, partial [Escherichia coli]|nr:NAD-glutamate dehydrogenase [Escherichia coli]